MCVLCHDYCARKLRRASEWLVCAAAQRYAKHFSFRNKYRHKCICQMAVVRISSEAPRLFYDRVKPEENRNLPQDEEKLSEAIQNLPSELREKILKGIHTLKIRERKTQGWRKVYYELSFAPFSEKREQIVKVMRCIDCGRDCFRLNGACYEYYKNGVIHFLVPFCEVFDDDFDCDESFIIEYSDAVLLPK